jgi:hypothetical protein
VTTELSHLSNESTIHADTGRSAETDSTLSEEKTEEKKFTRKFEKRCALAGNEMDVLCTLFVWGRVRNQQTR